MTDIIDGNLIWCPDLNEWRPWVTATSFGVDPGFGRIGLSALSRLSTGDVWSRGLWVIKTARDKTANVRTGMDDARRHHEIWSAMKDHILEVSPNVIGVEDYETRQPEAITKLKTACERLIQIGIPSKRESFISLLSNDRVAASWIETIAEINRALSDSQGWTPIGLGQASKTIGVAFCAQAIGFERGIPAYIYTPQQIKIASTGRKNASKTDVGAALEKKIIGLADNAAEIALTNRNHGHDATAAAYAALLEYEKWRAAYA